MSAEASSSGSTSAHANVLAPSEAISDNATHIKGPDFNKPIDLQDLLRSYETIGFQASGMARAIQIVEEMVSYPSGCQAACHVSRDGGGARLTSPS
jgi:deoxyhypusine synthase